MSSTIVARGDVRAHCSGPMDAPPPDVLDQIQEHWRRRVATQPEVFDGEILSVRQWTTSAGSTVVDCALAAYSWWIAARDRGPLDAVVRPLAVSAAVVDGARVLVGRRSHSVTEHPGMLELAGSGSVDRSAVDADGTVSWARALRTELREEVGIVGGTLRCLGLVHNRAHDVFDIVAIAEGATGHGPRSNEYEHLDWMALDDLVAYRSELVPTSSSVVELLVQDRAAGGR